MMTERYHGLDALRGGAMALGIVIHAALIFVDGSVQDATNLGAITADPATIAITVWIHLWRMPLFFILAGFFTQMVLERRAVGTYLKDRFVRILCTCLIFMSLFNVMTAQPWGTLDHLWFIWFLWWFCLIAAVLHSSKFTLHTRLIGTLFAGPWRMLWLLVPLTLMSIFLRDETVTQRIARHITDLEWRGFLFAILFFWAGQALWQHRARLDDLALARVFVPCLTVGTMAVFGILAIDTLVPEDITALSEMELLRILLMAAPLAGLATGALCFGMIGLCHRLIRRSSRVVTALVRLAYPVYVFHLWVVLTLSWLIYTSLPDLPQLVNIGLTTIAAFAVCAALYLILVRFTPLEWLFAGRKAAWWQWPFSKSPPPVS